MRPPTSVRGVERSLYSSNSDAISMTNARNVSASGTVNPRNRNPPVVASVRSIDARCAIAHSRSAPAPPSDPADPVEPASDP